MQLIFIFVQFIYTIMHTNFLERNVCTKGKNKELNTHDPSIIFDKKMDKININWKNVWISDSQKKKKKIEKNPEIQFNT